jgi:hypothetical protein
LSHHELIICNYPAESRADPRLFRLQAYEARVYDLGGKHDSDRSKAVGH